MTKLTRLFNYSTFIHLVPDAAMLADVGSKAMAEQVNHSNIGLVPETRSILWLDGTVCIQKGPRGMYKCYG